MWFFDEKLFCYRLCHYFDKVIDLHNRSILYRQFGEPLDVLNIESKPITPLRSGEMRARMKLAPINPSDLIPMVIPPQNQLIFK
jgi:hypothetical protein